MLVAGLLSCVIKIRSRDMIYMGTVNVRDDADYVSNNQIRCISPKCIYDCYTVARACDEPPISIGIRLIKFI